MRTFKVSFVMVFLLTGLAQISSNANAENPVPLRKLPLPAKECFASEIDYNIWVLFERAAPTYTQDQMEVYPKTREMVEHGPAKMGEITLKYKEVFNKDGKVRLDASESKTPSGKINYKWYNDTYTYMMEVPAFEDTIGKPGESHKINLKIVDPVCSFEKTEVINLKLK